MTSYIDTAGRITTIQRDSAGRITTTTYIEKTKRVVQYDSLNRPTSQIDYYSNNTEIQKLTYTYDTVGNPSGILDGSGVYTAYGYDAKNRVTTAIYTNAGVNTTYSYGYDAVDNKTFDSFITPTTFAYDLAGQLVTTYTYDANGNQTNQALPTQKTTMSYDKENRMATFAEDATLNTYTYDSDGFKKVENVGGSLSTIIWDGMDYLQVRGQSTIKTFHTVESQMMSYIESTLRYDFLTDNLGSITAIMDGSQIRIFDTRYSAYGRNNWSTGTSCGFGWVGSYGYRETGLFHMSHYVRARHYSYLTGNWSTVDPLWPDESAYGYVGGGSPKFVDPTGLAIVPILCIGACVGAGGCGLGLYIACKDWSPGYDSFADCALDFVKDLPVHSQVGCLVSAAGCLACIVKYGKEACKKIFDGTCTEAEWATWEKAIHASCDLPNSCDPRNKKFPLPPYDKKKMCDFIMPRLENGTACLAARVGRQIACFKSDRNPSGHHKAIIDQGIRTGGCLTMAIKWGCLKK